MSERAHERAHQPSAQTYGPTGGVVTGWVGLIMVGTVAVLTAYADHSKRGFTILLAMAVIGLLIWAFMLRPRIIIEPPRLVFRNALSETSIPLDQIESVEVRTVTVVRTEEESYVGVAVGHPVRKLLRESSGRDRIGGPETAFSGRLLGDKLPNFVEQRIKEAVASARIGEPSKGEVTRVWSVPYIATVVVLTSVFLLTIL